MYNTIDQFFSPTTRSPNPKRLRSSSSPEIATGVTMTGGDVVGVTRDQLISDLKTLLDEKMSNLATKEDLINVTAQVSELKKENDSLKAELNELRCKEKVICDKLTDLEARSRRNNLIFRGLDVSPRTDCKHLVAKFCVEKFGINKEVWINRAHPLGRDRKMVIAHFPEDSVIDYIMTRVSNLKGTQYSVQRDYPQEVRHKRACLLAVRSEVQRVWPGQRRMTLGFDHLNIEKNFFTWDDGHLKAGKEDGAKKLQQLCGQDFGEFLSRLKQLGPGGVRRPRNQPGETYPQAGTSTAKENSEDAAKSTPVSEGGSNDGH